MDDTCTALLHDLVEPFHVHLNSIDPNIQFTVESESEGKLPLLDVLLTREEDGNISTSVFRKPHARTSIWPMHAVRCSIVLSLLFNPYPFIWAVCLLQIFWQLVFPAFCASPLSHVASHLLSALVFIQCCLRYSVLMKATRGCRNIYNL